MIKNYIKLALKVMLRKRYYTALTLVGISFTIMIITVFASFIDQVIGPNPPEIKRGRTLIMQQVSSFKDGKENVVVPNYTFLKQHVLGLASTEYVSAFSDRSFITEWNGKIAGHALKYTDENFWKITDFGFLEGRPFNRNEVKKGARVAVISDKTSQFFFPGEKAVGKSIPIYGNKFKVIGVAASAPAYGKAYADVYVPVSADSSYYRNEDGITGNFNAMLLAKTPDVKQVRAELKQRMHKIKRHVSGADSIKAFAFTSFEQFSKSSSSTDDEPDYTKTAVVLMIVLIVFMLIPAISMINLNLSRIGERAEEIGVRKSFGATSGALINQLIIENVIITLVGGLIGLCLSVYASQLLVTVINSFDPLFKIPADTLVISWRVFLFSLASCLLFGVISGVYPAWKISRLHVVTALKGGKTL